MDLPGSDIGVYGLVTELCELLLHNHNPVEQHPYLPKKDDTKILKKLRSKAYGILLNKSPETYHSYAKQQSKNGDPVSELLKHSFVLRVGKRSPSQAKELEKQLDEIIDTEQDVDPVIYSALQFIVGLKSFQSDKESTLNVFHYGKANPVLPETLWDGKGVVPFQTYPMESFVLSEKFEAMLGIKCSCIIQDCAVEPGSRLSFLGRFKSTTTIGIESIWSGNPVTSMVSNSSRAMIELAAPREFTMASYFLPDIEEDSEGLEEYYVAKEGTVTEPEHLSPQADAGSNSDAWEVQISKQSFHDESEDTKECFTLIWEDVVNAPPVSNHRTWETLGALVPPKQPQFISETKEAMFHLRRIDQASILPLLPRHLTHLINLIEEVPSKQFLSDVRLLLLGIESDCFVYNKLLGFTLRQNLAIPGLSVEALEDVCSELTRWGTCSRALTTLMTPDPQTGKLQQEGLIFKVMCNSIKELLLCQQAAILRIPIAEGPAGLLEFLGKVRPMGLLVTEVARLCRCDSQSEVALVEGLGILTHIYQEVTKVTRPEVALVFYSILKACCEVYFRFLQKWLFEGVCDDIYGEFMIKVRPQYARHRGHRFWTRGFGINTKSVPGFLERVAESILQCGKAVRLLKICDPKNPLCVVFATSHPAVRVCLSVSQLREQQMHCREYMNRGLAALGPVVSLSSAFQEERDVLSKQAELVNIAQKDTLSRLKREKEECMKQLAQNKRELLAKLKDQVEEVSLRKEKDKEAQLQADKVLMDKINREQKEETERLQREKDNILTYYNELASEAEKRKIHADWRIRRMQLFDDRVAAISNARHELSEIKEILDSTEPDETLDNATDALNGENKKTDEQNEDKTDTAATNENAQPDESLRLINFDSILVESNMNQQEDENSNVSGDAIPKPVRNLLDASNVSTESNVLKAESESAIDTNIILDNLNVNEDDIVLKQDKMSVKSPRPTVLNITPISLSTEPIEVRQDILTRQAMNRNKNRVMGHSVYTNKAYYQKIESENDFSLDKTAIHNEALANRMKNTANLDAFSGFSYGTDIGMNNEVIANRLELSRLKALDNMTEVERNRVKILQEEYGWTPNNNESTVILSEKEKNSNCTNRSAWNDNSNEDSHPHVSTEIQRNRNRNTQHQTGQEIKSPMNLKKVANFVPTEFEKNRNRNTMHQTDQGEQQKIASKKKECNLTDAQKNRNRNMEQRTDQGMHFPREEPVKLHPGKFTDAQRNRARVMEQEFYICGSASAGKLNEPDSGVGTPGVISSSSSMQQIALDGTTPMSCTADSFPLSISSSLSQLQQCMDTPMSEVGSEMRSAVTTGDILTADTVRSDVTESGFKFPETAPMFPNFLGFGSAAMTPTSESSLTVEDVEMIDNTSLQVYLEKSVTIPLLIQSRLVNDALIKYLLREHNLLSHLHSLRSYFFLLNGEFARNLTNPLFTKLYEVALPIDLLNSATLNNLIDKALVGSLSYVNSERLSLSATDLPSQLQVTNPEALESLCLNYKVSWPLNIILDEMLMLQYSKVFKFLLMVGRVMWVLQEDFYILKVERQASNSEQYHKLQLYRHAMVQFMNALHNYLTCSVLHDSWAEFEKDLEHAITLDQLYLTHVNYIKKILFRCMLNRRGEKMRTCLCNVFKIILKFHSRVRSQCWISGPAGYTHPNYTKLEQLYQTFCELRTYLSHVADKLASSGYQPHLTHFLNALNINHLYDVTVKNTY